MSDIEPHELSAYLDGELSADRTRAVAAALASDPALQAAYEALADTDAAWRQTAQAAAFTPSLRWPQKEFGYTAAPAVAVLVMALVALKFMSGFADDVALALAVHTLALALALAGIAWLAVSKEEVTARPR